MSDSKQTDPLPGFNARLSELERLPSNSEAVEGYRNLAPDLYEIWQLGKPMPDTISPETMARKGKADALAMPTVPPSDADTKSEDADTMSGAERELIGRYQQRCETVHDLYKRFRDGLASRLARLGTNLEHQQGAAKTDGDDPAHNYYSGQIERLLPPDGRGLDNVDNELKPELDDFLVAKRVFLNFRNDHNLHRSPDYWSATSIWAAAIIMITLESMANGTFYAPLSELGLIGGWMVAVVVSAVIFSSAFMAGGALRLVNARRMVREDSQPKWEKSLLRPVGGVALFLATAALTVLFVVFVYLYRDVAALQAINNGQVDTAKIMDEVIIRLKSMDLAPRRT